MKHVAPQQRQSGSFYADHASNERVDKDEERELPEVLAKTEPYAISCYHAALRRGFAEIRLDDLLELRGLGGQR